MPYSFNHEQHGREAFLAAITAFVQTYDFTPLEVLRSKAQFPQPIVARADFLDSWDLWMFSEERCV